jgi:Tfp pilus assembly protein PilZ
MYITCSGPLPAGPRLHLQVFIDDQEFLLLEGVPIHAKEVPHALRTPGNQGFGLRFLLPAEALARIVAPAEPEGPLAVEYATAAELASAWERELRHGGVFIPTRKALDRDLPVTIAVRLPFAGITIEVTGTVLQMSTGADGRPQGVGLAFGDAERFKQLLGPFLATVK